MNYEEQNDGEWFPATPESIALRQRASNAFFDRLRAQLKRKSFVANPADPTQVTRYAGRRCGIGLQLTASWGVEAYVVVGRRAFRSYDARFFQWLFGGLEDSYEREQQQYDDDPMGRAGDYI
jgi:hypothetical protein